MSDEPQNGGKTHEKPVRGYTEKGKKGKTMAIYFVDGDNMPGMSTVFIDNLHESDDVYVLYAKGNTYYASEKNRTALINSTPAKVTIEAVFSDKNAVDFAIAIKAGIVAENVKEGPIFLISADHHFECIAKAIQWMVPEVKGKVKCYETIREAFVSDPTNIIDINILHKLFCSEFGHETGVKLYARCKELFLERFEEERKKKLMIEQTKDEYGLESDLMYTLNCGRMNDFNGIDLRTDFAAIQQEPWQKVKDSMQKWARENVSKQTVENFLKKHNYDDDARYAFADVIRRAYNNVKGNFRNMGIIFDKKELTPEVVKNMLVSKYQREGKDAIKNLSDTLKQQLIQQNGPQQPAPQAQVQNDAPKKEQGGHTM